ncbi:MAG: hypothetical protein KAS87_01480 [Candidatus Omnitrophica bacterium]|nr:hypothetical protein [Candidatus Omnitrophota bacterium]
MAEQRLSKLQKWILEKSIEKAKEKGRAAFLYRQEIYQEFFNLSLPKFGTWPKSKIVIVSRSLRNLEEKGFITIPGHLRPKGCMIFLSKEYLKFIIDCNKNKSLNVNQVD